MEAEQPPVYYSLKCTLLGVLNIPSLPRHPLWGNIINAGGRIDSALGRHIDYGLEEIWQELGEPDCFLLDLAPLHHHGMLIVAAPQSAEVIVSPTEGFRYSLPKDASISKSLKPSMGAEGIAALNGTRWRATRKRFSHGFQPQYIHSLSGSILGKVEVFVERLQALAETAAVFKMADHAADLAFNVITEIALAKDLGAQNTPEGHGNKSRLGLVTISRRLSKLVYGGQLTSRSGLFRAEPADEAVHLQAHLRGLTGRKNADGVVEKDVWSDLAVTSVPVDGMVMRVKMKGRDMLF